jgi:hypothetical protein
MLLSHLLSTRLWDVTFSSVVHPILVACYFLICCIRRNVDSASSFPGDRPQHRTCEDLGLFYCESYSRPELVSETREPIFPLMLK